ncbi:putative transposon Tn552 DNA-invertase bin3 [Bacteroidales bacterium Barb6]|nr:putative transposon Tn552 DNA-invertase bin3 [Bacteroidales bacterium Barb6]
MTKVGYVRVSTEEQNVERQLIELKENGVTKLFIDKQSGKDVNRKEFQAMLDFVHEDDVLVVSSLDRLGRNYEDVKATVTELKNKGVSIDILDAQFLNFNTGNKTLDSAMFDMFLSLLSYIAENERKKLLERQAQGIAVAKAKGVYKGKPREYSATAKDKQKRAIYHAIVKDLFESVPITAIAKKYNVTRKTVYRIRNENAVTVI